MRSSRISVPWTYLLNNPRLLGSVFAQQPSPPRASAPRKTEKIPLDRVVASIDLWDGPVGTVHREVGSIAEPTSCYVGPYYRA